MLNICIWLKTNNARDYAPLSLGNNNRERVLRAYAYGVVMNNEDRPAAASTAAVLPSRSIVLLDIIVIVIVISSFSFVLPLNNNFPAIWRPYLQLSLSIFSQFKIKFKISAIWLRRGICM